MYVIVADDDPTNPVSTTCATSIVSAFTAFTVSLLVVLSVSVLVEFDSALLSETLNHSKFLFVLSTKIFHASFTSVISVVSATYVVPPHTVTIVGFVTLISKLEAKYAVSYSCPSWKRLTTSSVFSNVLANQAVLDI